MDALGEAEEAVLRMGRIGQVLGLVGWRALRIGGAVLAAVGVVGVVPAATGAASARVLNWTKQHPATSPPGVEGGTMAYDAATGTVALFGGGDKTALLRDTWTWNGTTWTKHAPAASPRAREGAMMAGDAATGTVLLFGGYDGGAGTGLGLLHDTWTWG